MTAQPLQGIEHELDAGGIIVIDGGTGTELERRGARMHERVWSATAALDEPELLCNVHAGYIAAGARVIIANTFASNRIVLQPAGLGSKFETINRRSVELAFEALDRTGAQDRVAVAGSMSHHLPVMSGTDWRDPATVPTHAVAEAGFRELAELLAASGVDLIVMEMMSDPELANLAIAAALSTGLPVWVGFSVRGTQAGPVACSRPDLAMVEMFRSIPLDGVRVAGVMHSLADVTAPALAELRQHWSGPLLCYPDSGHFEMPNWRFVDVLGVDEFVAHGSRWIDAGVQVIGGCCGLGVEHIEGLSRHVART